MEQDITKISAAALAAKIAAKEISCVEAVAAHLDRIEKLEPEIHAFMTVTGKQALERAKTIDGKIARGEKTGRLAGVPVAVKDNLCVTGMRTTCSSKILDNYIAPYDAEVIDRLNRADAIIVGKTNLDEFAMGSSTENSAYATTRNPWNTAYIPGGSSGGSAAAVAAGFAPLALGSDTGGSIRQPAACCGVVGMKPTYGLVSRYGLIAFASSLDQIGPFARTVEDAALLLEVIAGHDPKDSTSVDKPVPRLRPALEKSLRGVRIGLPKEYFIEGLEPDVEKAVRKAVEVLKDLGAEVRDISLPHTQYAVAVYYIIAPSEASSNLARYDGVKYGFRAPSEDLLEMYEKTRGRGFGPEVKRRIMLGTYALSAGYYDAYYGKAQKVRTLITQDFENAFTTVDAIVTPTSPTPAFKRGERVKDPLHMYLSDIFTISCNLAGIPGISVPCGLSASGLPLGLQIMGRPFGEETVLQVGHQYEAHSEWRGKFPHV